MFADQAPCRGIHCFFAAVLPNDGHFHGYHTDDYAQPRLDAIALPGTPNARRTRRGYVTIWAYCLTAVISADILST